MHSDEFRVLDRLPKGYIDIKRGSWHVMKLFLPSCHHTAALYQRAGLHCYAAAICIDKQLSLKLQHFLKFGFIASLFPEQNKTNKNPLKISARKKKLEGNNFSVPSMWTQHCPTTCSLIHQWTQSLVGFTSAPTIHPKRWDTWHPRAMF